MINRILHLITNRNSFASPLFPKTDFVPGKLPPPTENLRKLLQLDLTTHDYYVIGALGAVYAFPVIVENFPKEQRTFNLADYQRPNDGWSGVAPIDDQKGPFVIRRRPKTFPVSTSLKLAYLDGFTLQIVLDNVTSNVPVSVSGQLLYPEWPADSGISGGLQLVDQTWDTTFRGYIEHVPISYPYAAVVEQLNPNSDKDLLLLQYGLIEQYYQATSPIEKLATVLLAMGLSNPA